MSLIFFFNAMMYLGVKQWYGSNIHYMVKIVNATEKQLNKNSKKDIYSEKTYRRPKDT